MFNPAQKTYRPLLNVRGASIDTVCGYVVTASGSGLAPIEAGFLPPSAQEFAGALRPRKGSPIPAIALVAPVGCKVLLSPVIAGGTARYVDERITDHGDRTCSSQREVRARR